MGESQDSPANSLRWVTGPPTLPWTVTPLGGEVSVCFKTRLEACMALTLAALDRATAARINPLISDISQKDTLANCAELFRALGAAASTADEAWLMRRVDYAPNKSPTCHASPKSVWVWVG